MKKIDRIYEVESLLHSKVSSAHKTSQKSAVKSEIDVELVYNAVGDAAYLLRRAQDAFTTIAKELQGIKWYQIGKLYNVIKLIVDIIKQWNVLLEQET